MGAGGGEGRVRIGVIGTGWWATQFHLPSLTAYETADVTALADSNPTRLAAAAEAFGVEPCFADGRALIDSGLVDGVVIAVPHVHHYALARAAIDRGLHVLVEKPMTLRAAEAWDLVDRADTQGVHLAVGYTYQFTRHARLVRDTVRSGAIGEIRLVSGLFSSMVESYLRGRPDDYREVFDFPITGPAPTTYADPVVAGGGQGQTQVTHPMGMVCWVTGLRPVEVSAHMEGFDLAVDLVDALAFRFDNDAVGTMASTGSLRPGQSSHQALHYYGTEGNILQDLNGRVVITRNDGSVETPPDLSDDELYPAEAPARCLVDLVVGNGENLAPGRYAAVAVEFLEMAYQSAQRRGGS